MPVGSRVDAVEVHPRLPVLAAGTRRGVFLVDLAGIESGRAPSVVGHLFEDEAVYEIEVDPRTGDFVVGSVEGTLAVVAPRLSEGSKDAPWGPVRTEVLRDGIGASLAISGLGFADGGSLLVVSTLRGHLRGYRSSDLSIQGRCSRTETAPLSVRLVSAAHSQHVKQRAVLVPSEANAPVFHSEPVLGRLGVRQSHDIALAGPCEVVHRSDHPALHGGSSRFKSLRARGSQRTSRVTGAPALAPAPRWRSLRPAPAPASPR
jgi:hypothetical protein